MIIPWQQLEAATLDNLLEEYVTRDGTDYGQQEVSTPARVIQVKRQLQSGEVLIVWDHETESCTLMTCEQYKKLTSLLPAENNNHNV